MLALGRRTFSLAVVTVAAAVVVYELGSRDERAIAALLNALCSELNRTREPASLGRLRAFLAPRLLPSAELHVAELELRLEGASAVLDGAQALLSGPPLSFTLSTVQTRVSGRHAQVVADLVVVISGSGEQHRDLRPTRIELAKQSDAWKIELVDVAGVAPDQPEPRP